MSVMSRYVFPLLVFSVLCFTLPLSARADTVTYTFETPQFTLGQTTPLLNKAPNVGSPTFLTSFTSSPTPSGLSILNFLPNPLFTGNSLVVPAGPETLTISFNMPVQSVQFVFALDIAPTAAPGQLRLTSPVGNLSQNGGNVGGLFQGGTFSFSSLTPFTTVQLAGFTSTGAGVEFAIDNLTVTFSPQQQPVPEPATMLLLGTGLAGLGGMIKRRRNAKTE